MSKIDFADLSGAIRRAHLGWGFGKALVALLAIGTLALGCRTTAEPDPPQEPAQEVESVVEVQPEAEAVAVTEAETTEEPKDQPGGPWNLRPDQEVSLFDGKSLGQWKVTDFGGQGDVHVKDGAIYLEMGSYATGITWSGPVVRTDYEITLEGMRVDGSDFFCALTFPVGESPCTLVLGGWGGTLCGLSNLDYYDASENDTTTFYPFKNKTWYHVRLHVRPERIQAWIDGEDLVDVNIKDRKLDIRAEMDLCQPLGIATWVTTGRFVTFV